MNNSERVIKVIAEQAQLVLSAVTAEKTFEDLSIDSLDSVETCMALEEEFDIEIHDEDWDGVSSVQGAIDLIERLKS